MSKYIDAEELKAEIERLIKKHKKALNKKDNTLIVEAMFKGSLNAYEYIKHFLSSLQQEQPIKVYRVENENEQKGLWRKFDGTWEPLFDMLTDGQCKDIPMGDSPIYREGGKQWFASAPSRETLQKWFSKKDLEELTAKGFTISEFEVVGHKKVSDFEYIFTRDNIISRTYLKVSDIYPQEQPIALIPGYGGEEAYQFFPDGRAFSSKSAIEDCADLFIITPEPELSEFEERIFKLLRQYKECDIPLTPENIKAEASMLWPDLEKYFFDLYGKEGEGDSALRSFYYRCLEDGKAEALKDMPRWRVELGDMEYAAYGIIGGGVASKENPRVYLNGHSIDLYSLEKLPGFKED